MDVATNMHAIAFITPGPTEWLLILAIVLVLFGAKKLPELARGLGEGLNEFRKAREHFDRSLQRTELPVAPSHPPASSAAGPSSALDGAGRPEVSTGRDPSSTPPAPTTAAATDGVHDSKGIQLT